MDGIVSHLLHSDDDSEESSSDQCDVCEDVTTHSEDIKLHKERCDFTSTSQVKMVLKFLDKKMQFLFIEHLVIFYD